MEKDYPLAVGDVITKIGDTPIDSRGFVKVGDSLNLYFGYLIPSAVVDGKVPLTVLRQGEERVVQVPTTSIKKTPLLYRPLDGEYPRFAIFGPLTFEAASAELVMGIIQSPGNAAALSAKASPLLKGITAWRDFDDQEIVVVAAMPFAHKLMKGYSPPVLCTVKEINGIPVKNLKHLVEILRDSEEEFLRFQFVERATELMIFPRKEFLDATDEILTDNNIRKQFSDDLEEVWKTK
jgi:hypothetical protein